MKFQKTGRTCAAATAAVAVLAGCSAGSSGSGGGGPLEKTSIVVDAFPAIDSAGLFIAEQRGLFKQQGLNVTIKLAANSQSAVNGQLAGTYDLTSADYVTYVDNVLLNSVTINNNVDFADVATSLGSGKVDASFAAEPFVSLDEMKAGTEVLADLDEGGATDFPIQGVAVTQAWARANPNTLAAFERAYAQGQELADTDRATVESAVETFLRLPPLAASLISLPNFPTGVDAVRLQRLVDAMVRFGLLSKQYSTFKIKTIIGNG